MIKKEISKDEALKFFNSLRSQDRKEIDYYFKENAKEEFIKELLKVKGYFVFDKDKLIAAGGIEKFKTSNSQIKTAQIWLLFSKYAENKRLFLFKYIKNRLKEAFKEYDLLFNYIYKSNFSALNWIKKCAVIGVQFNVFDTIDPNLKLFCFSKGEIKIDLRNFTRKELSRK